MLIHQTKDVFKLLVQHSVFIFILLFVGVVNSQTFPSKPTKIVIPYPAIGSCDLITRVAGQKLGVLWSQSTVNENRAGAVGSVGMDGASSARWLPGTAKPIADASSKALFTILAMPDIKERFTQLGVKAVPRSIEETKKFLEAYKNKSTQN